MEIEVLVTNIEKNLRSVEKSFNVLSSENRDFNFMLTYSKKIKIKLRNAKKDALSLKTELKSDGDEETKKVCTKIFRNWPNSRKPSRDTKQTTKNWNKVFTKTVELAKMKDEGIEQVTNYAYDLQDKTLETLANTKEVLVRTDEVL
ncbi:hypothetical protein MHBO_001209 [Bonamia ostreae]|uniref:Uncharacterized protein n=1 Tax=Bonamia ostreae TaxID=126728 RepID=A0ABV2AI80_9EUKA